MRLLIIFLFAYSAVPAQEILPNQDLRELYRKARIKSITATEHQYKEPYVIRYRSFDRNGNALLLQKGKEKTFSEYDSQGNAVRMKIDHEDSIPGPEVIYENLYDLDGKLLMQETINPAGQRQLVFEKIYRSSGDTLITEERNFLRGHSLITATYRLKDSTVREDTYLPPGEFYQLYLQLKEGFEQMGKIPDEELLTDMLEERTGIVRKYRKYNREKQLIETGKVDREGKYHTEEKFSYDPQGRLSTYELGEMVEEYTYDSNGQLTRRIQRARGSAEPAYVSEYTYDESGLLLEEKVTDAKGMDNHLIRYTYEYYSY